MNASSEVRHGSQFGAFVLREARPVGRLCASVLVVCGVLLLAWCPAGADRPRV